jgi:hypothetical protein
MITRIAAWAGVARGGWSADHAVVTQGSVDLAHTMVAAASAVSTIPLAA